MELSILAVMWIVFLFFGFYKGLGFDEIKWFGWILFAITVVILVRNHLLSKK